MDILRRGSMGDQVAAWQRVLGIPVDGIFGAQTELATKSYQQSMGLLPDGIVGPATWAKTRASLPDDSMTLLRGLDVSAVQGPLSDATWKQLRAMDIRFCIHRGVVGNEYLDSALRANMTKSKAYEIVSWPYCFMYPLPHLDPRAQAEYFCTLLQKAGIDLANTPIALDVEWPAPEVRAKDGTIVNEWAKWGCGSSQICEFSLALLARGKELTGRPWIVYSYPYFLARIGAAAYPEFAQYPLWIADYTSNGKWPSAALAAATHVPKPWSDILLLQFDGNGGLDLPDGRDADFDVLLGGEDALGQLFKPGASLTPIPPQNVLPSLVGPIGDAAIADYRRARLDTLAA